MSHEGKTRYTIAGELGKGGFGVVYLLKGENGHKLALKTVDLRKIPEGYRARATDEAKILNSLKHRHLVHHVNSYIKQPYLCIITEFCAAGDMDKVVKHLGFNSGLPEKLIVCWLMQTASALNYMHTHRPVVLHRDLKPQNIYVTEKGNLRVGDMGLARKLAGPADMATTQVGTIMYLSPEILNQKPYNSKSDIWSMGCVFHEITSRKGGDQMGMMFLLVKVMAGTKPPLPDHYSQELRNTITSMMLKDPKHRPSAGNILSSQIVFDFTKNPQTPMDIINDFARSKGRSPPQLVQDTSRLRGTYTAPLHAEDILVPADAQQILADLDREDSFGPTPAVAPPAVVPTTETVSNNPSFCVPGMSSNSMILFGGGAAARVASPVNDADETSAAADTDEEDTFYDSNNQPELGEEHLLFKIQQCQSECIKGIGSEILEAAYGVIGNVRDITALKKELKGLLGDDLYGTFGAKILELRALEYGLHKTTQRHGRR